MSLFLPLMPQSRVYIIRVTFCAHLISFLFQKQQEGLGVRTIISAKGRACNNCSYIVFCIPKYEHKECLSTVKPDITMLEVPKEISKYLQIKVHALQYSAVNCLMRPATLISTGLKLYTLKFEAFFR